MKNLKKGDYIVSTDYHVDSLISKYDISKLLEDYQPGFPFYSTQDWNGNSKDLPVEWFITLEEHKRNILRAVSKGGWNKGNLVLYTGMGKQIIHPQELTIGELYYLIEDYNYGLQNDRPSDMIRIVNNMGVSNYYYKSNFISQIEQREQTINNIIND